MPQYIYRGPEGLTYGAPSGVGVEMPPDAREPEPGKTYTLPKAPDDHWESVSAKKAARTRKKAAKAADTAPATPTPEPDAPAEPTEEAPAEPADNEESA